MIPHWVHVLAIAYLTLGLLCAGAITLDLFRQPQGMWIMAVVWPVTALFGTVWVLWQYTTYGRSSVTDDPPLPIRVANGALHCGAGCTLGDLAAEPLAHALGFTLWGAWLLDYVFAYLLGIVFQYVTITPMRGLSPARGLVEAIKADTLSLTAWQLGMYGFMALARFWFFGTRMSPATVEFWFVMQARHAVRLRDRVAGQCVADPRRHQGADVGDQGLCPCTPPRGVPLGSHAGLGAPAPSGSRAEPWPTPCSPAAAPDPPAMPKALKPLGQQTIVITGATSGIGLATARHLASQGATLFMIARNEDALVRIAAELREAGHRADYAAADVADRDALQAASARAIEVFGGYDSWINDAGIFLYGSLLDTDLADQRRLFDVLYWGTVHGSTIAAGHLRERGGAIINVGSVLGEFAMPFQGTYCAAKFAVKGFTEAFRREIGHDRLPISLTLIKPAAMHTPIAEHARNRFDSPGTRLPPPVYDPHLVARAIAHACTHRIRDITVGGAGGGALVLANRAAPHLVDFMTARIGRAVLTTRQPPREERRDNLYEPREDLAEEGTIDVFKRRTSLALEAQLRPVSTAATAALVLGGLASVTLAAGLGALRPRPFPRPPR